MSGAADDSGLDFTKRIFQRSGLAIMVTNAGGIISHVNEAFTRVTGYTAAEVIGKNPRLLKSGIQAPGFYDALWAQLIRNGTWQGEIWNRKKNGRLYCEWLTITSITDKAGKITGYFGVFSDITSNKRSEKRLRYVAGHDSLTRLPNRYFFRQELLHTLKDAESRRSRFAVVFLDLDNFKQINDNFGHAVGDEVLRAVSLRLQKVLRRGDTVARTGGDEFNLLLRNLANAVDATALMQTIIDSVSSPIEITNNRHSVSASAGLSLYPDHGDNPDELIRRADDAMYAVKISGKNGFRISGPEG